MVYEDGKPKRSDYRKFKIRTVQGPNDYASMEEVLHVGFPMEYRKVRICRKKRKDISYEASPVFRIWIMMDGGRDR